MNNNTGLQMAEREIRIESVLHYLWKRKLFILIGAVVITILAVTAGYYLDNREYRRSLASQNEKQLSEEQQKQMEELQEWERKLEDWKKYNESLLYMSFDSAAVSKVVSEYQITGDDLEPEDIADISALYFYYFESGRLTEAIHMTDEEGREYSLTREVIDYKGLGSDSQYFMITVYGADPEQSEWLAEAVEQAMLEYRDVIAQEVKAFEMESISQMSGIYPNESIYNRQASRDQIQKNMEEDYNEFKKSISAAVSNYLESENTEPQPAGIRGKYVVLGLIAGLFVMMLFAALQYMMSSTVKEEREIRQTSGLRCMGVLNPNVSETEVREILERIDSYRTDTTEEQSVAILTSVQNEAVLQSYVDQLQPVKWIWNMIGNEAEEAERVITLRKSSKALLIEKEDASRWERLAENIAACEENGIEILGYIYIRDK